LDFLLASGEVSKARATLRRWNRENPDRIVAWEWVEEAVIARIRGDAPSTGAPTTRWSTSSGTGSLLAVSPATWSTGYSTNRPEARKETLPMLVRRRQEKE